MNLPSEAAMVLVQEIGHNWSNYDSQAIFTVHYSIANRFLDCQLLLCRGEGGQMKIKINLH